MLKFWASGMAQNSHVNLDCDREKTKKQRASKGPGAPHFMLLGLPNHMLRHARSGRVFRGEILIPWMPRSHQDIKALVRQAQLGHFHLADKADSTLRSIHCPRGQVLREWCACSNLSMQKGKVTYPEHFFSSSPNVMNQLLHAKDKRGPTELRADRIQSGCECLPRCVWVCHHLTALPRPDEWSHWSAQRQRSAPSPRKTWQILNAPNLSEPYPEATGEGQRGVRKHQWRRNKSSKLDHQQAKTHI